MAFETLLKPTVIVPCLLILCYITYRAFIVKSELSALPVINVEEGKWFARARATWKTTFQYGAAVDYAYEAYSKKGLACIIPSIAGDVILLPTRDTEWIINQSDKNLDVLASHMEGLQTDYTFADPIIVRQPHHEHIVKTDLTRQLGALTEDIMDELATGFDQTWGFDYQNWKDIRVFENMMKIIARTSNRVIVGLPLCRNDKYLGFAAGYAQSVIPAAGILRQLPVALRPIVAKVVALPNQYYIKKTAQYLEPEIKHRLAELEKKSNDPEKKATDEEPNDFLQWSINYAQEKLAPSELSPWIIAGRLLALNFAAIHTSTFTITNMIFDLISTDPSLDYIGQLRKEAEDILAADEGVWTKKGLSKMYNIDSALRESLRVRSFLSAGLVRKVTAKEGITTPDGVYCPYGSSVGIAARGIHNDESIYPDATKFDPFRFVNARDAILADEKTCKFAEIDMIKKANYSLVSTSADYQPFGHGRHACPGRFFAANELKLLLAYMVINYDIELQEKRPKGQLMGQVSLPPLKAKIRVRRRKSTVAKP